MLSEQAKISYGHAKDVSVLHVCPYRSFTDNGGAECLLLMSSSMI